MPYKVVVMNDANGPRVANVSQRPGMIYYCVSKNLQEFWVTMTGLRSDIDSTAYLLRVVIPQDEILVVHAAGRDYPVKKP